MLLAFTKVGFFFSCRTITQLCGFTDLGQEQYQLCQRVHITVSKDRTSKQQRQQLQVSDKVSNHPSISVGNWGIRISTITRQGCRWNTSSRTLEMDPWVDLKGKDQSRASSYGKTATNHITSWFFS